MSEPGGSCRALRGDLDREDLASRDTTSSAFASSALLAFLQCAREAAARTGTTTALRR